MICPWPFPEVDIEITRRDLIPGPKPVSVAADGLRDLVLLIASPLGSLTLKFMQIAWTGTAYSTISPRKYPLL